MNAPHHLLSLLAIVFAAGLLVRIPRRLFAEAADETPARGLEWRLGAALTVAGAVAYGVVSEHGAAGRLAYALAIMVFVAVVYADVTFLIIPDLYSAALGVIALASNWRLPWIEALAGAAVCGGLLAVLAVVWRRMRAVEGLGFGDIKLAAVVGLLLGAQGGLLAVSISAGLAALLVYGLRLARRRNNVVEFVPYGAALALAGGAGLTMRLL